MDNKTLDVIIDKYPEGFLAQLGKELSQVVGLGEPIDSIKEGLRIIETPIKTIIEDLGRLRIVLREDGFLISMSYEGKHPLAKGKAALYYGPTDETYEFDIPWMRDDPHLNIDFPGFFSRIYTDNVSTPRIESYHI